ncbi:rho family-interacting cell polarization regulator 2-like isoform X2 [Porites lutea]|uniref:rho family-interacting cell polarization regulator 2-like isoform X2 n=1 Tax=Porites lutea TaxID=51062 RepID=UPI003CC5A852
MGKDNSSGQKPAANRHSRSLRMERGHHVTDNIPNRTQSVGAAAASRIRSSSALGHQSPAQLERKHSQIIRRQSGILRSKPSIKTPRIDHTTSLFSKLLSALSDYGKHLEDALSTVEPKRKRIVEERIKLIASRKQQIDEISQLYLYEQKMREGSRNLLNALTYQGSKGGQEKCRSSIASCTEKMCAIEEELETKLGVFKFTLNALLAFGRLCSGDVYDVHIKHGSNFKWKARCKVERERQRWTDGEFTLRPSISDDFTIRVIEMKKIQANVQIGNILLRSRNYIKARPQIVSVPLNSTGSMKLKITVEWRPFSGKEENTLRAKNQNLLSEVIFLQPAAASSTDGMGGGMSVASSSTGDNSSDVSENSRVEDRVTDKPGSHSHQELVEDATDSSEIADKAAFSLDVDGLISQESEEFRHATSLDSALQHLIPTLQSNKDQFPELHGLITNLEKLEELVKRCSLSRSSMSLSVESALESFDFLEQDVADETESTPRSTASGGSECHDTGYNSTDDYNKDFGVEGGADASYIVDFFTSNKTVDNLVSSTEENRLDKIDEYRSSKEFEEENDHSSYINDQDNADIDSSNDSPHCITDIFSSLPSSKSMERSASEDDAVKFKEETINEVPSNTSSPRKRIEAGELIQESPQHSSYKTRSSRATSPNLSSSYAPEATVGNKVLDKVILCHLQFCEEMAGYLGSFGPMKFKEMSALSKLRQQKEVLERLIQFVLSADLISDLSLPQINPRLVSNPMLASFWEKTCQGQSALMFTTAGQLVSAFEDNYKSQITQSYNRVVDIVFPVIVARVIHQDPELTDVSAEEEDLVTVFQFEHFFMDCCRPNLSKYINDVAYELVIGKRLRSPEKDAVVAQLKQYTEIPLSKSCFCPVLFLLLDTDFFVSQAAEAYLLHLQKNGELRRKAIGLSIEALEESEEKLRQGACVALTVLQARDAVPQLLYLSRCDVQSVKLEARKALSSLGDEGEDALRQSEMSTNEITALMF